MFQVWLKDLLAGVRQAEPAASRLGGDDASDWEEVPMFGIRRREFITLLGDTRSTHFIGIYLTEI
jgi:hypothetical protein